jgi:hypothetical protein
MALGRKQLLKFNIKSTSNERKKWTNYTWSKFKTFVFKIYHQENSKARCRLTKTFTNHISDERLIYMPQHR